MENIIIYSLIFLSLLLTVFMFTGKNWSNTVQNFLFANRSLTVLTSGAAISSHWIWAIALFVGPAFAYNWGLIGLLWFIIPNALSLIILGLIIKKIRNNNPEGFSFTTYIKNNFSKRVSVLYQLELVIIAFGALLLGFTAISKLWAFANLSAVIEPIYAGLIVGLITLLFTVKGGIRTSIITGAIQTILWLLFLGTALFFLLNKNVDIITSGKNNLMSIFDYKFLTTAGIAYFITITFAATGHGHLWQKAFSMPKENIVPSFTIGAILFAVVITLFLSLSLFAFAQGFPIAGPDTSALVGINELLGIGALILFGVLFIGQTSTVMDSSMNYMASLVSLEWFEKNNVLFSRFVMIVFMLTAWIISWSKLEIWTIMMLMGAIRTVMFVPLILHVVGVKIKEQLIFYTSLVGITGTFYFAWTARIDKSPVFDMYSALYGVTIPILFYVIGKLIYKNICSVKNF